MNKHDEKIAEAAKALAALDEKKREYFKGGEYSLPSRARVIELLNAVRATMFRGYISADGITGKNDGECLEYIYELLKEQLTLAQATGCGCSDYDAKEVAEDIITVIPAIKEALIKDAQAIYVGDPAAVCAEEVILTYPGFTAISIYRIAHELYIRKIPYLPRIMTEYAHEITGVDIHAGATIGEYFFIDHGTGIVIGETTTIGDRVKIYQGVTLGAKSFELDEDGNPVKGTKRHPDIGNGVIVYANATILGGKTKIGDGAVIGANVWLTSSVAAGETIYYTQTK